MKKIFTTFILLTLASCSAYEDWDHRGPETPTLREQRTLMLPPNFKEEAPTMENSRSTISEQKSADTTKIK
ncbi:MAG: hypothetical protein MJ250_03125 [Alphaproteobacteria bacterium]|nr:hypothetical protein [Alphaproteobacteria bacterium]